MSPKDLPKVKYTGDGESSIIIKTDRILKKETEDSHQNCHIQFLADSSGSINKEHFLQIIATIKAIICKLHEKNPNHQFTLIEFASNCKTHFRVSSDKEDILAKLPIDKTNNIGFGTNLALGLQEALVINKNEMTDDRRKFLYIFTDGFPDSKNQAIIDANQLKIAGVDICCVGIGSGINMDYIKQISPHKGHHVQEWEMLNQTFEDIIADEYNEMVRVKFSLMKRPYKIGTNVELNLTIKNNSEKIIPKGSIVKFYSNSYFEVNTAKTKMDVGVGKTETFKFVLDLKDSVTVRDLCQDLKYSISTPSSAVIEKGIIKFWASDFAEQLVNYKPPCGVLKLNITVLGLIGCGKSSFVNRVMTLVDGMTNSENKHYSFSITAPGGDHVTKHIVKNNFAKIFTEDQVLSNLKFSIGDSYGVTQQTYTDPTLLQSWYSGMLGEEFAMGSSTQNNRSIAGSEEHQIHCVLFFLSQGDRGDQSLIEKLKSMYQESLSFGLQPLVIITKIDEVRENETPRQVIEQVSVLIGANTDLIFATENYWGGNMKNDESERNFNIDKETLIILLKALDKGDTFIKSKKK